LRAQATSSCGAPVLQGSLQGEYGHIVELRDACDVLRHGLFDARHDG
jgi:hypothetical protein